MTLSQTYKQVRQQSLDFCKHLQVEDFAIQVVKFASPPKWHLAHTTWFFETFILIPNVKNYAYYNSNFNFLFNSYYNNVGDRVLQANRGNMSRPTTNEIFAYRDYVDEYATERKKELGDFLGTVIAGIYEGIRNGANNIPSDFEKATGRPHKAPLEIIEAIKSK